jgi:4'-phosphopantetheinyl transferase
MGAQAAQFIGRVTAIGDITVGLRWTPPPAWPALEPGHLHVWAVDVDVAARDVTRFAATLTEDERVRAGRYRFERDHRRFVVRRGVLRDILARYLGGYPGALRFAEGPRGKPCLAGQCAPRALHFNLSDCDSLVLYAVRRGADVGVDVERVRELPDAEGIAERFFSPSERVALRRVSPSERPAAFFNCWTRKEAYIKATGDGLSCALDRFDVTLTPGEPPALLRIADSSDAADRWAVHHLEPAADYVGALAAKGAPLRVACWSWRPS